MKPTKTYWDSDRRCEEPVRLAVPQIRFACRFHGAAWRLKAKSYSIVCLFGELHCELLRYPSSTKATIQNAPQMSIHWNILEPWPTCEPLLSMSFLMPWTTALTDNNAEHLRFAAHLRGRWRRRRSVWPCRWYSVSIPKPTEKLKKQVFWDEHLPFSFFFGL